MNKVGGSLVAAASVPMLALFGVLGIAVIGDGAEANATIACAGGAPGVQVSTGNLPGSLTAGGITYRAEQLAIAAQVIQAGADLGISARGQTIGVMTAIGESSLTNVDYGDKVGPDSRGVFQQRANGAWGSYEDRMNPYVAATNFYRALLAVPGWETLAPTIAAHRTQRNADPYHYERYWDDAVAIVGALAGVEVDLAVAPGTGGQVCTDQAPGQIPVAGEVTRPVTGPVTSGFGPRWGTQHNGLDFGAPAGTPIYAAAAGRVVAVCLTNTSPCTGYGTLVSIDHGGGVVTRYAHAYRDDVLVRVGDTVQAGQQITRVGSNGDSTGPHLHWEVQVNGAFVDPASFAASRGIVL